MESKGRGPGGGGINFAFLLSVNSVQVPAIDLFSEKFLAENTPHT